MRYALRVMRYVLRDYRFFKPSLLHILKAYGVFVKI